MRRAPRALIQGGGLARTCDIRAWTVSRARAKASGTCGRRGGLELGQKIVAEAGEALERSSKLLA